MKRSFTTMSGGVLGPRKKRKISSGSGLTSTELARVRDARAIAESLPWSAMNYPIPSGAPSGLYNLSTNTKEYKFVDTSLGSGGPGTAPWINVGQSNSPEIHLLNGLKLGTSAFQRIGNKIAMKSVYTSVMFNLGTTDSDPSVELGTFSVPVRFMIVYDKQTNGAPFVLSDLLSNVSGVDNTTSRPIDVNSPNNLNNRDRFIVLADKRFVLQPGGPSGRHIKKFKRLNTSVAYKSGATVGNVTDITSGSLYAIAFTDQAMYGPATVLDTWAVNMSGDIRVRYQDD